MDTADQPCPARSTPSTWCYGHRSVEKSCESLSDTKGMMKDLEGATGARSGAEMLRTRVGVEELSIGEAAEVVDDS